MFNFMLRRMSLAAAVAITIASRALSQIDEPLNASEYYGRGVHAYFAGRSAEAEELLSRALALDPNDPRTFYFRALSRLRCGRAYEAREDMQIGAALEVEQLGRFAIGSTLLRVQGSDRLLLEKYRQQARNAAFSGHVIERYRTRQNPVNDARVLRQQVVVPLDEFLGSGTPRALTAQELADRATTSPKALPQPGQPALPQTDPFSDDAPVKPVPSARPSGPAAPPAETTFDDAPAAEAAAPAEPPATDDSMEADDDPFNEL